MTHTILIVDDDDIVVFIHKMIIRECNISIDPISFDNGSKAFDYLNNNHREFEKCLILLDIQMPVMNGWQLLDILEEAPFREKLAVVLVTSSIDSLDRKKSEDYPLVCGFISKPLTMENCSEIKSSLEI
ncbi:response regulator [Flavihumibacter sp. R14]|nr:response regulator [Flavihumibacter soli]